MSNDDIPTKQTDDSSTTDATETTVDGGTVVAEAPQSRFWGTIPSEWELVEGSEVYDVNPSYTPKEEEITYIEMDALDTELPSPKYAEKRKAADYSGKLFREGDTLFARITPCTENGKAAFIDEIETDVGIGSTEYAVLSPDRERIHPLYLYYVTKSHPVRNYAISRMRGSTGRQRVPFDVFRKELEIALPPMEEQRRICTILRNVDLKIDVSQRLIDKTTRLRKALLQYLFDESRFDDVPFRELRQLGDWGSGSTPSKDNSQYWGGDIPWLSPKDIFQQDTPRIKDTEQRLTEEGAEETNLYPEGSIAVVVRSGVLDRTLPLAKLESRMAVNQDIKVLNPDSINPDYLLYAIEAGSENIRQRGRKQGTTWVDSIATMVLTRHSIPVPDSEYQQKVVEMLENLDEALTNQKKELRQTKRFKSGLLQDLMTGQIRTRDTEIDVIDQVKQDD